MEHYVTLFDSLFLPQGLALHMSMERRVNNYTLWVLCVDDETHSILTQLSLPNVSLLRLSNLETKELLAVKPGRTKGEYCWTLTPFAPRFVFEATPELKRVTYIDADLWFRKDPSSIFDEFEASGKAVLITEHSYSPEYDQSATSGQFCVQFMTFDRIEGEEIRKWWEKRCVEWCFGRFEDGKFGDQKYLDLWPEIFKDKVHVLVNKELCLAPWNATRFPYSNSVFYHFHDLRIIGPSEVHIGYYSIPKQTIKNIHHNYIIDLDKAISLLKLNGVKIKIQKKKDFLVIDFIKFIRIKINQFSFKFRIKY